MDNFRRNLAFGMLSLLAITVAGTAEARGSRTSGSRGRSSGGHSKSSGGGSGGCGSKGGAGFRKANGKCADKNGR